MEKLKKNWPIVLLILAISGCIFILNIATPKSPDDYSYATVVGGDDLKITSFSEIWNSAKYFYTNWTGRIIPHILIGIFMTTSPVVLKIINTLLFLVLIYFISKFITHKTSYLSLVTAFGFLVFGKMFGEKFAWISGSLNYLWTTAALIIYLYTIYGHFVENCELKKWQKCVIVAIGFLIGFSHEVIAFVGCSFLGMLFLGNIRKIWKNSRRDLGFLIFAILFFGLGTLCTVLAPGNVARSTLDIKTDGSPLACLGNYKDIKGQLIITLITIITVGILKQKEMPKKAEGKLLSKINVLNNDLIKKEVLYFVLPCIIATTPFAIMGYFTPRCFLPYEALIIIVAVTNLQYIVEYFKEYRKSVIVVSVIATILVFSRMLPTTYSDIRYIIPYNLKVNNQLNEAKKNGDKDVIVSKFLFMDKIRREDLINVDNFFVETDSKCSVNTFLALYYGFDVIRAISDIDYFVEIETDISEEVEYGILNKDTLELLGIVKASNEIDFTIPKEKLGTYVVDCRDKDLRSHVKSVRIRGVGEELENADIEMLINQEK